MNLIEATTHFHEVPTQELTQFTIDHALKYSRYLFTQKVVGKMYKTYCTYCKKDSYCDGPIEHLKVTSCPNCKTRCIAFQAGRGRGKLVDNVFVEFCEKSLVDPEAITFSAYYVTHDLREDYHNPTLTFLRVAMYVFKPGQAVMYSRTRWGGGYEKRSSAFSLHNTMTFGREEGYLCKQSILRAVKGTSFQYAFVDKYENHRVLEYLDLYCKYPVVELLYKLNLKSLVDERLTGHATKHLINWRGKTLDKILRLPKRDWKHFRNAAEPIRPIEFNLFQQLREFDSEIPAQELIVLCQALGATAVELKGVSTRTNLSLTKIYRYISKQREMHPDKFKTLASVFYSYRDYLNECADMNVDLTNRHNLFPKDVYELHQRQIERKKAIADVKFNLKIRRRYRELCQFEFSYKGLSIHPFMNAQELTYEGNRLIHCISSYAKGYAEGSSDLFMIRTEAKPDEPYYTLEMKQGRIVQCRGYRNCAPTEEVAQFMEQFKLVVLKQAPEQVAAVG